MTDRGPAAPTLATGGARPEAIGVRAAGSRRVAPRFPRAAAWGLASALLLGGGARASEGPEPSEPPDAVFTPRPLDGVVFNPGMGLYLQYPPMDSRPDEWFVKIADIAYYRLDWAELNPRPGAFRFQEVFGPTFDFWVKKRGKRVAFRVMSESPNSKSRYVTPKWVFDKGVPGVKHRAVFAGGHEQTCPVFWDPKYMAVYSEFVAELGRYLDGRPGLEFVDLGGIGVWGEMHLGTPDVAWTREELDATGFTEAKYVLAYRAMIDAYRAAFPRTRLFLNVGSKERQTIHEYAASRGIGFRQDGLSPTGPSYGCDEWLFQPYSRRGVACNLELYNTWAGMKAKGWDPAAAIRRGLEAPISYLNANLFAGPSYRQAPPEAIAVLTEAARRVGYRMVLSRVEHPARVVVGRGSAARFPVRSAWRNDGTAAPQANLAVEWSLLDPSGKPAWSELAFPKVPTTQWWSGEVQPVDEVLRVPATLPRGTYRLAAAMLVPETSARIALAIEGREPGGRYLLDEVEVAAAGAGPARASREVRKAARRPPVFADGFEGEPRVWRVADGISASADAEAAHEGKRSLLVSGSATTSWSFATLRFEGRLIGGARYRLSAWMRVDEIDPPKRGPHLKLAVRDADGKFLGNHDSRPYDLARLGAWQEIEVTADLPAGAASGEIGIEKGDTTTPVKVKLRVDELVLDLVEGG